MKLDIPAHMPPAVSQGRGRWLTSAPWACTIEGHPIEIPAGFLCDLYSTPFPISIFIPRDQRDNRPALIHDWLYATLGLRPDRSSDPVFSRWNCDRALYFAARQCGLPLRRCWSIHTGVRLGGWLPWSRLDSAGFSLSRPCLGANR